MSPAKENYGQNPPPGVVCAMRFVEYVVVQVGGGAVQPVKLEDVVVIQATWLTGPLQSWPPELGCPSPSKPKSPHWLGELQEVVVVHVPLQVLQSMQGLEL